MSAEKRAAAADLAEYVSLLRRGNVLACATETLVGLLADARSEAAVQRVVAIKQRGADPIALIAPDLASVELIAELNESARDFAARHWPGPLTLVVRARPGLPAPLLRDGTVGVRVPGSSPARDIVRAFAAPLTATSCNPSGLPAARTIDEAQAYFGSSVAGYVPGDSPGGPPSTIVDVTGAEPRVLRQGAIALG